MVQIPVCRALPRINLEANMNILNATASDIHYALSESIGLLGNALLNMIDGRTPEAIPKFVQARENICKLLAADLSPPGLEESGIGIESLKKELNRQFLELTALHQEFTLSMETRTVGQSPEDAGLAWFEKNHTQKRLKLVRMKFDSLAASWCLRQYVPNANHNRN
jgi:hypothetical protein